MSYHRARREIRLGMGQSNINPTTIWTPQTGYITSESSSPGYVAPAVIAPTQCDPLDTACVNQDLAIQQANMAAATAANYNSDVATCNANWAENDAQYAALNMPRPPNNCSQQTYGLVLPSSTGGTNELLSNAEDVIGTNAAVIAANLAKAQLAAGINAQAPTFGAPGAQPSYVAAPTPTPSPVPTPAATTQPAATVPGGGAAAPTTQTNYVAPATGFFDQSIAIGGTNIPDWLLAAAGLALVFFVGGRH